MVRDSRLDRILEVILGEKIVYQAIQYHSNYALDENSYLGSNKMFFVPRRDLYLLGVLNSPLIWWFSWRLFTHMKDEALSNDGFRMEQLPIATVGQSERHEEVVERLVETKRRADQVGVLLQGWYAAELEIARPSRSLLEPFALSLEEFVEQIRKARGAGRSLSAAGVHAVREEYMRTVQPMQAALREAERLEWQLSDLVNGAYGLTPDEVRLIWQTAPPRMPLTPTSETVSQAESEPPIRCPSADDRQVWQIRPMMRLSNASAAAALLAYPLL